MDDPEDSKSKPPASRWWPHAPPHWLFEPGIYIVTASTYQRAHYFNSEPKLDLLLDALFEITGQFSWQLEAWAVLSNHYHFVARSPGQPETLRRVLAKLHMSTAREINILDKTPGRRVWYQYRDTRITHQSSYLARLAYVHGNPVHHGLVRKATEYRWCSAAWFVNEAPSSFVETLRHMKVDKVNVPDDF